MEWGFFCQLADRNLIQLKTIETIIKERQDTFGKVLVGFAFSRTEENEWRVCFGLVNFLKKEESFEEITHNYGNFTLLKRLVSVSEARDLIQSIVKENTLKIDGCPKIPLIINMHDMKYLQKWYSLRIHCK